MNLKGTRTFFYTVLLVSMIILPWVRTPVVSAEELITMNFEDADIRILIKFISEITQKNFIIDDKVKGKVTIISPEKVTIPEAYNVFESILDLKGFTLIPAGQVIKIVPSSEAKQRGIQTIVGKVSDLGDRKDEFVTRITRLRYVNADEIATLIRPLFSKYGNLIPYKETNTLIMTDIKSNLHRIMSIINQLDVKGYHAELYVIPLHYASVRTISDHLNKILEQGGAGLRTSSIRRVPNRRRRSLTAGTASSVSGVSTSAKIISDERTNSLIVLATKNDYETITKLVERLDVKAPSGTGRVNIYYLQNAIAEEVVAVLNKFITGINAEKQKKGGRGGTRLPSETDIKIVADKATNSLIIDANPQDYKQIKDVIEKLDIPRAQVLIEALIMEVRGNDTISVGVDWETLGGKIGKDDSIDRLGFGGSMVQGDLGTTIAAINAGTAPPLTGFNLGVFGNFIEFNGQKFPTISALIKAVASRSDTDILSTPQILTMDNEEAEIKVGENRPFLTQARTGGQGVNDVFQTFDFRDVGVTMKVTPHISQNGFVRLKLFQEISNVNAQATEGTGATAPVTTKRSADTTVTVQNGHTIVIGGLIGNDVTQTESKVPCLGDLPWIKYLFRSTRTEKTKTNLMIFLTPHIIMNPTEAAQLSELKDHEFKKYQKKDAPMEPSKHFYGPEGTAPKESTTPARKVAEPTDKAVLHRTPHPTPSPAQTRPEPRKDPTPEETLPEGSK
ncbi:MAG: type II secretion system secretin GspD [Deltaproteobacteria bacterium]|nr:type II secretion system secretin GspD [Deltaproteobacteria bacterium]